jgi:Fe2+ transport system protein B
MITASPQQSKYFRVAIVAFLLFSGLFFGCMGAFEILTQNDGKEVYLFVLVLLSITLAIIASKSVVVQVTSPPVPEETKCDKTNSV